MIPEALLDIHRDVIKGKSRRHQVREVLDWFGMARDYRRARSLLRAAMADLKLASRPCSWTASINSIVHFYSLDPKVARPTGLPKYAASRFRPDIQDIEEKLRRQSTPSLVRTPSTQQVQASPTKPLGLDLEMRLGIPDRLPPLRHVELLIVHRGGATVVVNHRMLLSELSQLMQREGFLRAIVVNDADSSLGVISYLAALGALARDDGTLSVTSLVTS